MTDSIEYSENHDKYTVSIMSCARCQQAHMKEIAHAESMLLVNIIYFLLICTNRNCNAHAWAVLRREGEKGELTPIFILTSRHRGIPRQSGLTSVENIISRSAPLEAVSNLPRLLVEDFDQAMNCFKSSCYDAAACMSRRTLERALLGKGAQPYLKLTDMIAQLTEQGKLPLEAKALCEDIKSWGNLGAHSSDSTCMDEAQDALFFTDMVITWLYGCIKPANIE